MGVMSKAAGALGGAGKGLVGEGKATGGGGMMSGLVNKAMEAKRSVAPPRQGMGGVRTVASRLMNRRGMSRGRR